MPAHKQWAPIGVLACMAFALGCGNDTSGEDSHQDGSHLPMGGADGGDEFPAVPCPDSIPDFEINLEAAGDQGLITGRLLDASNFPPRLGRNDWTVEFVDDSGASLEDVELEKAEPWMPVHRHGGRYPPEVMMLEPGQFQVDRLDLRMRGPWEVRLDVNSPTAGEDRIVFHVCVD